MEFWILNVTGQVHVCDFRAFSLGTAWIKERLTSIILFIYCTNDCEVSCMKKKKTNHQYLPGFLISVCPWYHSTRAFTLHSLWLHIRGVHNVKYRPFIFLKSVQCIYKYKCVYKKGKSGIVMNLLQACIPAGHIEANQLLNQEGLELFWLLCKLKFSFLILHTLAVNSLSFLLWLRMLIWSTSFLSAVHGPADKASIITDTVGKYSQRCSLASSMSNNRKYFKCNYTIRGVFRNGACHCNLEIAVRKNIFE